MRFTLVDQGYFDRIYIEISNICNLQCSFCPEVLRPKKMMTPAVFRSLLQKVKPYAKAITLHVMGEPLAHPQLDLFLNCVDEAQVPLILTTNGLLIQKHAPHLLQCSSLAQINFSLQSFIDNFPNKPLLPYLEKLTHFAQTFVAQSPSSFVNYRLWTLKDPRAVNQRQLSGLFDDLQKCFSDPEIPSTIDVRARKSYRLDRHIKLHFDTQFEWPSLNQPTLSASGYCHGLTKQLAILTDGSVVPCCLDKEAVINLGCLLEKTLPVILAGERAQRIIDGFQHNQAVEPLCQKCQFKTRFRPRNTTTLARQHITPPS